MILYVAVTGVPAKKLVVSCCVAVTTVFPTSKTVILFPVIEVMEELLVSNTNEPGEVDVGLVIAKLKSFANDTSILLNPLMDGVALLMT